MFSCALNIGLHARLTCTRLFRVTLPCAWQVELDQYESAVYDLQQRIDQLKPSVSDTIMVLSEQPAPLMKMV